MLDMTKVLIIIAVIGVMVTTINMMVGITEGNYGKASFWLLCLIINATALIINKEALQN